MIIVRNLRLETREDISCLGQKAAKKLRIPESDIVEIFPVKRSLDARKKNDIHYNCSAAVGYGPYTAQMVPVVVVDCLGTSA